MTGVPTARGRDGFGGVLRRSIATLRSPLIPDAARGQRSGGRIAGCAGRIPEALLRRWRTGLGSRVKWLEVPAEPAPGPSLVRVDADTCELDGERLPNEDAWRRALGAGRLADIRGGFALAWRNGEGALELARDAIGERRLYFFIVDEGILFASSLRDLLLAFPPSQRALHEPAIAAYLCCAFVPGRETPIAGIEELLPGTRLRFARGKIESALFFELPREPVSRECDELEVVSTLRAQLERAVERRLPDGRSRVGASLSGGVDSSLVAALASRLHSGPLHTFSIGFGRGHANELPWSSWVANHIGSRHHVITIPARRVLECLDDVVATLDEPNGDPLTVPNALLFREAARHVDVVLNGEGGDPCFGGPKNLPMLAGSVQGVGSPSGRGTPTREQIYLRAFEKCSEDLDDLLSEDWLHAVNSDPVARRFEPLFDDPRQRSLVAKLMTVNLRTKGAHHILPKVDQLAAPFGVEARSPLFDRDVVELAFGIPAGFRLRGNIEKYVLKRAVDDLLPREIIERPKSGMLVPVEAWFRGPMRRAAQERLLDGLAPFGIIRRDAVEKILAGKDRRLHPRRGAKLWLLVTLEAWLRRVFAA